MKSPILILSVLTLVFAGCKDFTNQDGPTKMPLVHKGEIIFPEDEYNSVKDAVVFKAEMEELFIYNEKRIEGLKIKASHC